MVFKPKKLIYSFQILDKRHNNNKMALVGYGSSGSESEEEFVKKVRAPKKIQAFLKKPNFDDDDDEDGPSPFKRSRPMGSEAPRAKNVKNRLQKVWKLSESS